MTDTDDTDELLVIPPDFFLLPSEFDEDLSANAPYFTVVNTLISQVNSLQGRIDSIETANDTILDESAEYSDFSRQMINSRKYSNSSEDIPVTSYNRGPKDTTPPRDNVNRIQFNSLPSTPSTDRSPVVRKFTGRQFGLKYATQSRNIPQSSEEQRKYNIRKIDAHIEHEYNNVARNLNLEFPTDPGNLPRFSTKDSNYPRTQNEGPYDYLTSLPTNHNQEAHYKNVSKLTVEPLLENTGSGSSSTVSSHQHIVNGEISSGSSGRSRDSAQTALFNYRANVSQAPRKMALESDDTFAAAQTVIHENRALLSRQRAVASGGSLAGGEHELSAKGKLLSLSDLWGSTGDGSVVNKLAEEKLRRLHCEQTIQELQTKILELQERLAVALQVDNSKDEAILKFQGVWEQVAVRIQEVVDERNNLEQSLYDLQVKTINELEDAAKKVNQYESESSKALNLAHNNQEKLAQKERKLADVITELELKSKNYANQCQTLEDETKRNIELSKILGEKEIELNDSKKVIADARKEISQSKKAIEICQAEFTTMKTQYTDLELLLHSKQDTIKTMESQKRNYINEIDILKNITCKKLEEEVYKAKTASEKNKSELREFYQSQVEIVVQEKLSQFQKQLDQAETGLHKELKNREQAIAETAALHIQQLSNKHALEVKLLEEKHHEELSLQQLQTNQLRHEVNSARDSLREHQDRKAHIASQLHRVMEAQWREAMRIINRNGNGNGQDSPAVVLSTLERLNSRSRSNLEEMLELDLTSVERDSRDNRDNNGVRQGCSRDGTRGGYSNGNSGSLTERERERGGSGTDGGNMTETPTTSKESGVPIRSKEKIESELQRYVEMLLNKPAGNSNTVDSSRKPDKFSSLESNYNDSMQTYRVGKPPWK